MNVKKQLSQLSKARNTVNTKEAKVTASPVVQDPTLQTWIKQVSTEFHNITKNYARKQELAKAGVISVKDGEIQPPTDKDEEFSTFVPLAVENLYAGGAYTSVTLSWEQSDSKYFGQNDIFRSEINDFGTAVKVGSTRAKVYTDYVGNDAKVYYWVRTVSRFGINGELAPSVYAETAQSFEYIKDLIVGKIEESWISQEFNNVLNGIKSTIKENTFDISETQKNLTKIIADAKETLSSAIAETEYKANQAIEQAKMLLSQSITNEIDKTNTLIESKTKELKDADLAQASTTDKLAVQMRGGYDGNDLDQVSSGLIYQQRQTTTTALETISKQLSLVSASGNSEFDSGVIYFFDDGAENWLDSLGGTPDVVDGWIKLGNKAASWTITSSPFKSDLISSKYNEIRLRIRRIGEPANDLVVSVQDSVGNVQSRVVDKDAYGYDQLDVVTLSIKPQWTVATINRISISRANENTYSADDYFAIDWVAIGRPSPAASYSTVSEEIIARVKGDEVNNSKIESYYSELKNNDKNINARIDSETSTRVTNEEATTKRIVNAETKIGENESSIQSVEKNLSNFTESTSIVMNALNSKFVNLSVGGHNLIKGTEKFDTSGNLKPNYVGFGSLWDVNDTLLGGNYIYLTNADWCGFYFSGFANNVLDQDCILSFWASNQDESTITYVYGIAGNLGLLLQITSSKWQQYSIKLPKGTLVANNHNQGVVEFNNPKGATFAYSSIQLQYGNQATQWSPHPDDITNKAIAASEASLNTFKETYAADSEASSHIIDSIGSKINNLNIGSNNLLKNSSLEKDMNGWIMNLQASYSFVNDSTLPNGKSKCLKFTSTGYGSGWYQPLTNLRIGDEFTYSILAKGETGTEELWMLLEGHDKNKFITLTKDWKLYTFTAKLQYNYSNVSIYARNTGTFYLSCAQYERGNIATDWKPNASEAQANLESFKEAYTSAEEARSVQLTQMDSKFSKAVETTNTALSDTDLIARSMTSGKLLFGDPIFKKGFNDVVQYNNVWNGRNKIERVLKEADNPTTSTHQINVTISTGAEPYYGGFYQTYNGRPNAIFLVKYIMKIPVGYRVIATSNLMGDGYTDRIIGNVKGTGRYETYYRITRCGITGFFSSAGHLALLNINEPMLTGIETMTFPLASIECYDLTDYADMTPAVQESFASINESLNTLTTADAATASKILQLQANYDASSPNMRMPTIRDENLGGQWSYLICHVPNGLNVNNPIPYSAINTAKFIRKGTSYPSVNYHEGSYIPEEHSLTLFRGFVYVSQAKSLVFQNVTIDDAVTIYVNETQQYHKSTYGIEPTLTLNLIAGWNKFDVLIFNGAAGGELTLNPSLVSQVERLYPVRTSDILEYTGATALSNYITKENAESTMAGKIEEFNVSSGLKGIRNYVLYSGGLEATQGGAGYIKNLANGEAVYAGRSYMLIVFDGAGNIQSAITYDVYGGYVDGFNTAVANLPTGTRVAVITSDEPLNNKSLIRDAIFSLGGTAQKFDSMNISRGAYLLVGCKNAANTYGVIELVSNYRHEGLEYGLTLGNGKLFGLNTSSALSQYLTKSDTEKTISGKFEEFSTTVSNQVKADLTTQKISVLDLRHPSYGRDTWYPVLFKLWSSVLRVHIEIYARLDEYPSDAAWITHGSRTFSCQYTWEVGASGWGANPIDRQISTAEYLWATGHPVLGIGQWGAESYEIAYVRGGGVYNVSCHKNIEVVLVGDAGTTLPNSGTFISPTLYSADLVVKTDQGNLTTKITETTQVIDGIKGIKSVFIDNNGVASGYATTSELINGQVSSSFGVYANTFFVADPANPNSRAYPLIVYNGKVVMEGAIIRDGTITNAKIGDLSADKITTGDIAAARMSAGIVEAMSGKFQTLSSITAKIGRLETTNEKGTMIIEGTLIQIIQPNGRVRHKMGLF